MAKRKKGHSMKAHTKRGGRALGLGALALLLVATLAAGGCSPGPSLATPGPEEYHIYDGREGIQTQAEVINASRAVAIVEDPAYSAPVTMIVFGMSPTKVTASDRRMFRMTDEEGNILAEGEGQTSGPFFAAMDPLNPLYSYQLGSAITPYWLALLQQN